MWTLAYETPDWPYGSGRRALFMSRDSGHALVLNDGTPHPVTPPSGAANSRAMWLGDDGRYVVGTGFVDDSNTTYGVGLYSGDTNSVQMRRLPGQVFVDRPGLYATAFFSFDSNADGTIVFHGELHSSGWADGYEVIGYGDVDQGFRTAAIEGAPAPGLGGATFADFDGPGATNASNVDLDWISDEGDFVFRATLAGTGVNASNDLSLWAHDREGMLSLIAREGDVLQVNGKDRTIASFGLGPGFFDEGTNRYTFGAVFTDNSRGFFQTQAIPEPAGAAVAAGAAAASALRRRRRS
jgi:uncharacterized protein (TIGR03382 family)